MMTKEEFKVEIDKLLCDDFEFFQYKNARFEYFLSKDSNPIGLVTVT